MSAAWPVVPLGEFLIERREAPSDIDLLSGKTRIVDKVSFNDGRIHLRQSQETKTGMILVQPGDILVSGINAAKGAIAIHDAEASEPLAATIHYGAYQTDESRACPKFLWWLLRSNFFRGLLARHVPGGIKTELKSKRLLPIPIPLPPLAEQRRLVARIEELATKIESARDLRSNSTSESEILLSAACENKLIRAGASAPMRKLSSLVDPDRGISYGIVQTGAEFEGGIPTLRAGDLQWFHVNTSGVKLVDPEIEKSYLRTRLQGGELLLRIRGGVGELAVCPESLAGGNVSREIAVIPLTDEVLPRFAMFLLSARSSQAKMHGNVRGTSYLGINLKDVRELEIPVPTVSKQREILSDLESVKDKLDTLAKLQSETRAELDAMLPAILDKAFKGEL